MRSRNQPLGQYLPSKRVFPLVSTGSKSSQLILQRSDPGGAKLERPRHCAVWRGYGCSGPSGVQGQCLWPGLGVGAPGNFSGFICPRLQEIITESRKLLIMKHENIQKAMLAFSVPCHRLVVSPFQMCFGKSLHINNQSACIRGFKWRSIHNSNWFTGMYEDPPQ